MLRVLCGEIRIGRCDLFVLCSYSASDPVEDWTYSVTSSASACFAVAYPPITAQRATDRIASALAMPAATSDWIAGNSRSEMPSSSQIA